MNWFVTAILQVKFSESQPLSGSELLSITLFHHELVRDGHTAELVTLIDPDAFDRGEFTSIYPKPKKESKKILGTKSQERNPKSPTRNPKSLNELPPKPETL